MDLAQFSKNMRNVLAKALETLAVIGPIICLVDCLVIPIAIAILPLAGMHHVFHGIGDQFLTFLVLAICAPVMLPGFFKHRRKSVLVMMGLGFGLIFFANYAGSVFGKLNVISCGKRKLSRPG